MKDSNKTVIKIPKIFLIITKSQMSMYWIDAIDDTIHSSLLGPKLKIKLDR